MVNLQDCPICEGPSILEEECGSGYYVVCMDCGAHTPIIDFKNEDERVLAAKRAADLWNFGKVIQHTPGE